VAIGDRVDVSLRKAEVDHIYGLVVRWEAEHAVSKLDVAVKDASRVHSLQPCDLHPNAVIRHVNSIGDHRELTICMAI